MKANIDRGRGLLNFTVAIAAALIVFCCFSQVQAQYSYYAIHVGSFKTAANADQDIAKWRSRGYEATSRYESVPGKGWWHRVYIGRFETSRQASEAGRGLEARRLITYFSVSMLTGDPVAASNRPYDPAPAYGQASYNLSSASRYYRQAYPSALQRAPVGQSGTGQFEPQQPPPGPNQRQPMEITPPQTGQDPFSGMPPEVIDQLSGRPPGTTSVPPAQPGPYTCPPTSQQDPGYCTPQDDEGWQYGPDEGGPFTLYVRNGITFWPNSEDFVARRTVGGVTQSYQVKGPAYHLALVPSFRIWNFLSWDASIEKEFAGNMDLWYFTHGPRFTYDINNQWSTYLKGSLVYGVFDWDGPGDFDPNFGWDIGLGFDYKLDRFRFGMEALYRGMYFYYRQPTDTTATLGDIDLSGITVSGSFGYNF